MIKGGFRVDTRGRVCTTFGHNPSSLRLCSFDPNLQNIPRGGKGVDDVSKWVKECFVAPLGSRFWERDYSGIEAVLVGYFAGLRDYYRLAKLGVHAYVCSHMVGRGADLGWSDADLSAYFALIKKEVKQTGEYDVAKRIVHGSNYVMTPRKMSLEYPETFPTTKDAAKLQGLYFDLFPGIRTWHTLLCQRVDGTKRRVGDDAEVVDPWTLGVCHVRNPFGYVHRFYNVLDWELVSHSGTTEWVSSFGEDAKRLVSFLPQSTAAAMIKRAAMEIYYQHPWVGATLRLLIHDAIFGEARDEEVEGCLMTSKTIMERSWEELPLDPTWQMGEYVSIGTEAKVGQSWGAMS